MKSYNSMQLVNQKYKNIDQPCGPCQANSAKYHGFWSEFWILVREFYFPRFVGTLFQSHAISAPVISASGHFIHVISVLDHFSRMSFRTLVRPSLKKCLFGIAYPGFHLVGGSIGIFSFFLNIYYLHMDGNGKKIISDLEKKLSSS